MQFIAFRQIHRVLSLDLEQMRILGIVGKEEPLEKPETEPDMDDYFPVFYGHQFSGPVMNQQKPRFDKPPNRGKQQRRGGGIRGGGGGPNFPFAPRMNNWMRPNRKFRDNGPMNHWPNQNQSFDPNYSFGV